MILRAIVISLVAIGTAQQAQAETTRAPSSAIYQSRYVLAGYLLRAGAVCDEGAKQSINAAFRLLASKDLKVVSRSFPAATESWMTEGAGVFNADVMKDGIESACAAAILDRQHLENADPPPTEPRAPLETPSKTPATTRWISVEADNGAVTKVDMNSIQRGSGAAIVFTYADEGNPTDSSNLQGYMFDCQGHYSPMGLHSSPMIYAPPRSVAAKVAALACAAPVGTMPH